MHGDERPRFHLTAPANWMNDPNGLFIEGGRLHVFYQHNPFGTHWDRMHWGHAVTDDLVRWTHLPLGIAPDDDGPDAYGCWSGCIVGDAGTATMFYTGVVIADAVRAPSVCRATSSDGLHTWTKDPANPLIAVPPPGISSEAFRDPFVYRDDEGWAMLVGAGTTEGLGAVLLYRSDDLRAWRYVGPFLATDDVARDAGADGPCWECPQLLRFDGVDVLIVSVVDRAPGVRPSHVNAFVGRVEGDHFVVDHAQQLGMGPDFYAPATVLHPDGRALLLGWIPEDPPHETAARTWTGSMTFPRIVSVGPEGRVSLSLAEEVTTLRAAPGGSGPHRLAGDGPGWRFDLVSQHFEVRAVLETIDAAEVTIDLLDEEGGEPEVRIAWRPDERRLSVARRGIVGVAGRSSQNAVTLPEPDFAVAGAGDRSLVLRLLVDGSVMEMEADGRTMATFRLPTTRGDRLAVVFEALGGDARVAELASWELATAPGDGPDDGDAGRADGQAEPSSATKAGSPVASATSRT